MFLLHPASRHHASVLPCVEAPLGESTVLSAVAGLEPMGPAGAHVLGKVQRLAEGLRLTRAAVSLPCLSSWTS